MSRLHGLAGLLLLLLLAGCETRPPAASVEIPTAEVAAVEEAQTPPTEQGPRPSAAARPVARRGGERREDLWYAFYRGEKKFGFAHTTLRTIEDNGQKLRETTTVQEMTLPRGADQVTQRVELVTRSKLDGEVVFMSSRMSDGGAAITTEARCGPKSLELTIHSPGKSLSKTLPWSPAYRGQDAEQASLHAQPLKPGETRTVRAFLPLLNVIGTIRFQARAMERVETPFGEQPLLRIETQTVVSPEVQIDSVLWADNSGTIRKFWVQQGDVTAMQTVQEAARAPDEAVDLFAATQLRVERPIPQPHRRQRAVYRVRLHSGEDPQRFFATGISQSVRSIDAKTAEVEVRAILPTQPPEVPAAAHPPEPADLAANALIQHDDAEVRAMLADIRPAADDPWSWAVAAERYVHEAIDRKVLTQAFRTAAEVARQRQGDCTEHAVLLAALCRAHGLPTRVVTGLVAYGDAYAFHMWNEVWLNDRWVPLDATLAQSGIGAGHLKLTDSSLDGVSPFTALMPVLEIIGQLELEVVAYE